MFNTYAKLMPVALPVASAVVSSALSQIFLSPLPVRTIGFDDSNFLNTRTVLPHIEQHAVIERILPECCYTSRYNGMPL